jgi:hypothetical protein
MGSLTAHLLEPGDHGRLPFHPSCPVCRQERLYGTLSSEPAVSRRSQALLAGGLLAISSSAPAAAIAQEPDRQFEGVAAPEQPGADELDDPSFDPGGDTALSFDTAPAPAAPAEGEDPGDGTPLDVEPTVDLDARLAPLADTGTPGTDSGAPATGEESGVPPAGGVPLAAPGDPTGTPPGGAAPPGAIAPPTGLETPGDTSDPNRRATSPRPPADRLTKPGERENLRFDAGAPAPSPRVSDGVGAPAERDGGVAPVSPGGASAPAAPSTAAAPSAEPIAVAEPNIASPGGREKAIDPNDRFYVVQPGDSLWSIAKRLLGPDASAGRIAREVNRLWSLNRSRIATGHPDLLMVGTRLDLR